MSLKVSFPFLILTGKYVLFNYCIQHVNKDLIALLLRTDDNLEAHDIKAVSFFDLI